MKLFYLQRVNSVQMTSRERGRYADRKFLCNDLLVYAETEQQARTLASVPMPRYGLKVRQDNTIDVPCAWCYDTEPAIWADPELTVCREVVPNPKNPPLNYEAVLTPVVSQRSFVEIGCGELVPEESDSANHDSLNP